jgi:hypothetical protein
MQLCYLSRFVQTCQRSCCDAVVFRCCCTQKCQRHYCDAAVFRCWLHAKVSEKVSRCSCVTWVVSCKKFRGNCYDTTVFAAVCTQKCQGNCCNTVVLLESRHAKSVRETVAMQLCYLSRFVQKVSEKLLRCSCVSLLVARKSVRETVAMQLCFAAGCTQKCQRNWCDTVVSRWVHVGFT